jgi:hypothetical protein
MSILYFLDCIWDTKVTGIAKIGVLGKVIITNHYTIFIHYTEIF